MHTWSKYKYLLNMPGGQPWSYRFKYLLAMKSLVIDIVVHQQYGSDPNNYNLRWDSFFDSFFRHNRDYIQIPFRWIEGDQAHNQSEHQRVIQRVEKIFAYYEKNEQAYTAMVQSCTRRLKHVSQLAVYHGISVLIKEYTEAIRAAARITHTDLDTELGLVGVKAARIAHTDPDAELGFVRAKRKADDGAFEKSAKRKC
ncbi:hypothetical protein T484DRAFT_1755276 [Baffinella frigidus]|nr:hypothetical protein T484DRAFT_1755276 [Cryptophyta sp. CCMP2293]